MLFISDHHKYKIRLKVKNKVHYIYTCNMCIYTTILWLERVKLKTGVLFKKNKAVL